MQGKYLYYRQIDLSKATGIQKKILYQIKELNKGENHCEIYCIESEWNSKYRFFLSRLPFVGKKYDKWRYDVKLTEMDYLYIRRPSVFDSSFLVFLRGIKKENPLVKIIVELPSYPYDQEYGKGIVGKFYLSVDKRNRKKLWKTVDRFAVVAWTGERDILWEIPVLPIFNGIDLLNIKRRSLADHDGINLVCVGYFSMWHGYELVIEGLRNYYSNHPREIVRLHMVGDGPERERYQTMVKEFGLSDHVIFYGEINGGLDKIYDIADIGVCGLKTADFGVSQSSQLKSREYLAKGLPVITAGDIDILQNTSFPYEHIVECDRPINIHEVVHFYQKNCLSGSEKCCDEIRLFAEKYCGWEYAMSSVFDYIEK